MKIRVLLIVLFIPLLIAIYFVQIQVDQISWKKSKAESLSLLPKGEILKTLSLGYTSVIADLLWLEVVQAIGDKEVTNSGYQWIYHAADVVTTLDPKFEYSYQIAGIALAYLGKQYELSNKILLKGIQNSPEDWRLPFYLGFNYFFYLNDYENAAVYMSKAASYPEHPAYLHGLAARLSVEAKNPEFALDFLKKIYQDTQDENTREELEKRIMEVMVERDILFLNRALEDYEKNFKKKIKSLIELTDSGMIHGIPKEPFGGNYFFDEKNHTAQSSTHPNRMKVYRKS